MQSLQRLSIEVVAQEGHRGVAQPPILSCHNELTDVSSVNKLKLLATAADWPSTLWFLSGRLPLQRFLWSSLWVLLGLCCSASATLAQALRSETPPKSITVVLDDNYPPFIFRDSAGQLQGILKDSWALWEARTGVAVKLRPMEWAKAL